VHPDKSGLGKYPTAHVKHFVAPGAANEPVAHFLQVVDAVAPTVVEYVFLGHFV